MSTVRESDRKQWPSHHVRRQRNGRDFHRWAWKTGKMDFTDFRGSHRSSGKGISGEDICTLATKQLNYVQWATVHGFLTKHWNSWHKAYLKDVVNVDSIKSPPPDKWVADLIMHIWDINFNLWCKRCELAHGSEEKRIITINGENIDQELKDLYHNLPHPRLMNASERNVFSVPLRKVLALPVKRKLRYLRCKRRILDNYLIRRGTNRSRDNMVQWLQPGTVCPIATPNVIPTPIPTSTPTTAPTIVRPSTSARQAERPKQNNTATTTRKSPWHKTTTPQPKRKIRAKKKKQPYKWKEERDIIEYFSLRKHDDEEPPADNSCDNRKNTTMINKGNT